MADIESNIRIDIETGSALANLKNLQREISAFQTSLAKGSATSAARAKDLQQQLLNDINASGKFSANLTKIKSSAESFTTALEKNKLSMGEYFRYSAAATKTFGKTFSSEFGTIEKVARERVKTLQTQYIKLGRDANGAMQSIAVRPLALDMNNLGTQTAIAAQKQQILNQLLRQGSTNLLNFGKNTQWAGRQLMVGFTIPLTILGTTAAKTFMEMEEAAIKFKKVYGDLFTSNEDRTKALEEIKQLGKAFTQYGVAVSDTVGLAAEAAAAGFQGVDLQRQTTAATRLAILGQIENQKALETTISLQNAFQMSSEKLAESIDFLNAVENQTVVSLDDITTAIPKVAPVIQQLGGDVKDLSFFLAAMKEGGINASEGANALKSGLAALINPTGKASEMLAGLGINIKGIVEGNQGDLKGTIVEFARALDTLDPLKRAQAIEQLFGKFQFARLSTLFENVAKDGNQASRVLELASASAADLAAMSETELGMSAASSMNKFKKAVEELNVALAPVGEEFLKAVTPLIEFGTKILDGFNNLDTGVKSFVTKIVGFLGIIGPVAIMTFGLLMNGVANVIKSFTFLKGLFDKTGKSSLILGEQTDYMTQQQLEAAGIAASLDQVHQKLKQTFTSEAASLDLLTAAYGKTIAAQRAFSGVRPIPPGAAPIKMAKGGVVTVGGSGNKDTEPALLTPGEAVIPKDMVKKYQPLIEGMIAGNIPGYAKGVMLGMPKSSRGVAKHREAADEIYQNFLKSNYANTPPTNYGHQISPTSGHSFPIFGLGGVYQKGNKQVFVKPVIDERSALAEMRSNEISRRVHGLEAPEQRIVVIRDPLDASKQRRFLALESDLNPKFINNQPMGLFNEEQYFKQLVASLLRVDKDLSASNVFGNVVADAGPAGVFSRASGARQYGQKLPSMEEQAMVNLLGIRGGAKRAFAESTLGLITKMTPEQYHQKMLMEIQKALPALEQTIASFRLTNPSEVGAYDDMIRRLKAGLGVDWRKFHAIHSAVKPQTPKQSAKLPGYNSGGIVGGSGNGDVIPAMLTPGEFVIKKPVAQKILPFLEALNTGKLPGFNGGGLVAGKTPVGKNTPSQYENVFAHIAEPIAMSLENFVKKLEAIGKKVPADLQKKLDAGLGKATVRAYGGLGFTTKQSYNEAMKPGRAGVIPQDFLDDFMGRGLDKWNTSLKIAGVKLEDVANDLAIFDKAISDQILAASTLDDKFVVTDKAISNFVEQALKPLRAKGSTLATAFDRAAGTITEIRGNATQSILNDAGFKRNVERGAGYYTNNAGMTVDSGRVVKIGGGSKGKTTSGVLRGTQISEILDTRIDMILDEGIRGIKTSTAQASPSKKAYKAGENIGVGSIQGIESTIDDAKVAGTQLGNAVNTGTTNTSKTPRRFSTDPMVMESLNGRSQSRRNIRRFSTDPLITAAIASGARAQNVGQGAVAKGAPQVVKIDTTPAQNSLNNFSQKLMPLSFAISSVSGILMMFGGELGEVASLLFGLSSALFALTSITELLAKTKMGEAIASAASQRASTIAQGMGASLDTVVTKGPDGKDIISKKTNYGSLFTKGGGIAGLFKNLGTGLMGILRFLTPVGIGLSVLAIAIPIIANVMEEQRKKIEGLGNTANLTAEKLDQLGSIFNVQVRKADFAGAFKSSGPSSRKDTDLVNQVKESENFKTDFAEQISAIKNASAQEAQLALQSMSVQLAGSGFAKEQVNAIVKAIAQEAGRTDLNLSFASLDLSTPEGLAQVVATAKAAGDSAGKAFAEGYQPAVEVQSLYGTRYTKTSERISTDAKKAAETAAGSFASLFQGIKTGFDGGLISSEEFNNQLNNIVNEISKLDPNALSQIMPALIEKLGLKEQVKDIDSLNDQLLVIKATAAGVDPKRFVELAKAAAKSNDPKANSAALRARKQLTAAIEAQTRAQEQLNLKEESTASFTDLQMKIDNINEQIETYKFLRAAGFDAATAIGYAADETVRQGIASAQAAGQGDAYVAKLRELAKASAQFSKIQSSASGGGGGGGQKSPFAQAIEQLKNQKKEITNSISAYSKLRKAGMSVAAAFEISKDATLAAAIASTKVGTAKWKQLLNLLKQIDAAARKNALLNATKENMATEQLYKGMAKISPLLSSMGLELADIENIMSDPNLAAAFIKDLKDGVVDSKLIKNYLNSIAAVKRVKVIFDMSTPEGAMEVFNEAYDRQMAFFDHQAQAVEMKYAGMISSAQAGIDAAQSAVDAIQDKIDSIQDTVDAKNRDIELNISRPIEQMQEQINDLQREIEMEFERPIKDLQEESDILSNDLKVMDKAAEAINKKYDAQEEALQKISDLNQEIVDKQKRQISLADAITQGDISAAAQLAQEMRAADAQARTQEQSRILGAARDKELEGLISPAGMTRDQIEQRQYVISQKIFELEQKRKAKQDEIQKIQDKIYNLEELREAKLIDIQKLEDQIYDIQVNQLKAAERRLEAAQKTLDSINAQRDAEIAAIDAQRQVWEQLKWETEEAMFKSEGYLTSLEKVKEMVEKIKDLWNQVGKNTPTDAPSIPTGNPTIPKGPNTPGGPTTPTTPTSPKPPTESQQVTGWKAQLSKLKAENAKLTKDIANYDSQIKSLTGIAGMATVLAAVKADRQRAISERNSNTAWIKDLQSKISAANPGGTGSPVAVASGGLIPKYMAKGGDLVAKFANTFRKGTDTVPAMLTPGEFVIRKPMVDKFGTDFLSNINNGDIVKSLPFLGNMPEFSEPQFKNVVNDTRYRTQEKQPSPITGTVYNSYEVNVNVTTDADPNRIAREVITQIKQIDSQRLRGNRY